MLSTPHYKLGGWGIFQESLGSFSEEIRNFKIGKLKERKQNRRKPGQKIITYRKPSFISGKNFYAQTEFWSW